MYLSCMKFEDDVGLCRVGIEAGIPRLVVAFVEDNGIFALGYFQIGIRFCQTQCQVEAPLAVRFLARALVCMEMNKSALALLAISARRSKGMNMSRSRV